MKILIITVVVLILNVSVDAGGKKHHSHHKKPKQDGNETKTIDMCPLIGKNECRRASGNNINECESDNDCKKSSNSSKCCYNMCRDRICTKPVKVSTSLKSGNCPIATFDPLIMCSPPISDSYYECRQDSECTGSKKCCSDGPCGVKKCRDPVDERKGVCPEVKYNMQVIQNCKPFSEANFGCRKDSDCKNQNQKCCKNECWLLTCQDPTLAKNATDKKETPKKETPKKESPKKESPKKESPKKESPKKEDSKKTDTKSTKSGSCPVSTFDPLIQCTPVDPKYWDCREDSECSGTQKCCHDGPCGVKKCKNAMEARKGECPIHKFDYSVIQRCNPFSEANFKCKVDSDCKQNASQKCCRDPCYLLTCQNAVAKKNNY